MNTFNEIRNATFIFISIDATGFDISFDERQCVNAVKLINKYLPLLM